MGEPVHFVLNTGPNCGQHRPAVVVRVVNSHTVNLQVFSDGTRGDSPKGDQMPNVFWKPGCYLDDSHSEGTWHWPEEFE